MRVYADTSFLVKLMAHEPGSETAVSEFRRLGFPRLVYLPLHALEVENAIRQRVFQGRRSTPVRQRAGITRERDAALARVARWLSRGWLVEATTDCEAGFARAQALSERHTERMGCRGFDLLHMAFALELDSEVFLTADRLQSRLAHAEGLKVWVTEDA